MLKRILCVTALLVAGTTMANAKDDVEHFNFNQAVQNAVSQGVIDGKVRFYLAGTGGPSRIVERGLVSNKKTNGFAKSAESACERALFSALVSLDQAAKSRGASAVTNIVSYYKKNEYRSSTMYECHKGTAIASVTLKADVAK